MRLHATHTVTILGERVIGEDELGNELTESDAPLVEAPARVDSAGTEFVMSTTGERVRESPTVTLPLTGTDAETGAPVEVMERVEEGQDVQLDDESTRYRIESVDVLRARGHRPENVRLSVQKHG